MIQIQKRTLIGEFSRNLPALISAESKIDFMPLLATIKREYWSKLGLSPPQSLSSFVNTELEGGEIYISKSGNIYYYKLTKDLALIECGALIRNSSTNEFGSFFSSIDELLQQELKSKNLPWEKTTVDSLDLISRTSPITPTREETIVSAELEKPDLLRSLLEIKGALGLKNTSDQEIDKLVSIKLVNKDYVVLCKERGQQIIKVNSREAIEETSQKGFKCFLCGKPISEEKIEELLALTELGERMTNQSYWLPVRVVDILTKLGLGSQELLTEKEESFFTSFFIAFGEPVLVSVFDQKFTLTDAYTLSAKLSVNHAGTSIILNPQGISPIFQEFLVNSVDSCAFFFFNDIKELEQKLFEILSKREQQKICEVIQPFSVLTPVELREVITQKLFEGVEEPKRVPPSNLSSSGGAPVSKRSRVNVNKEEAEEEKAKEKV